ncbi:DNA primase [Candidatus Methanoperedenaceae archaeon GB50]|nr:DNA primase [Candidatus Methanoperedenaceae archaeon GB50]
MSHIPPQFIEEVKNVASIVEIIGEYVSLRKRGKNYVGLCPFHQETAPSFTVSEEKQLFYCFGCGTGGNVFTFLMKYKQCSFYEAIEEVAQHYGIPLPKEKVSPEEDIYYKKRKNLLTLYQWVAEFYHHCLLQNPEAQRAREYLSKRDIGKDTVVTYLLGYAPPRWDALTNFLQQKEIDLSLAIEGGLLGKSESGKIYDRFRGRIIFPIFDLRGNVIAFGGRVLDDTLPKYINSPETLIYKKGFNLYGAHVAKQWSQREEKVLLVEGYFDLLSLHACGIRYAVASLGTALTTHQAKILKSLAPKVILVYDADAAGQKAAIRSLSILLKEDLETDILLLPAGDDPDSFVQREGKEAMLLLLQQTQGLLDWYLKKGEKETKKDLNQRYQFIQEALNIISLIKNPLTQSYYRDKICQLFHIEPSLLLNLNKKSKSSGAMQETFNLEETLPIFEKNVVKFLLHYPQYISWFDLDKLSSEIKHSELALLLEKIVKSYQEKGKVDVKDLMLELDPSLQKFIARWVLERDKSANPEEIAHGLLRQLQEREFKGLLKDIKEAEENGDWQRLSLLLRQKNKFACNLKKGREPLYE